jgi:hypothetical protein
VTVAAEAASDLPATMEYISSDWQYMVHEKIFLLPFAAETRACYRRTPDSLVGFTRRPVRRDLHAPLR